MSAQDFMAGHTENAHATQYTARQAPVKEARAIRRVGSGPRALLIDHHHRMNAPEAHSFCDLSHLAMRVGSWRVLDRSSPVNARSSTARCGISCSNAREIRPSADCGSERRNV